MKRSAQFAAHAHKKGKAAVAQVVMNAAVSQASSPGMTTGSSAAGAGPRVSS